MTENTQRVGNNPGAQTPGASPSELENLVQEFGDGSPDATPSAGILKDLRPVIDYARQELDRQSREKLDKTVDDTISFITSIDASKGWPKRLVRGFLEAYAIESPAFKKAFDEREQNTAGWNSALETARAAFIEDLKGVPGSSIRSDLEAATAAVRGTSNQPASTEAISAASLFAKSDREFEDFKLKHAAGR